MTGWWAEGIKCRALPALGYGFDYKVAAYAVRHAGLLSKAIASDTLPWLPKPGDVKLRQGNFVSSFEYRRTTAIGRVAIYNVDNAKFDARILAREKNHANQFLQLQ